MTKESILKSYPTNQGQDTGLSFSTENGETYFVEIV